MTSCTITSRMLARDEATLLNDELRQTPNITGYTASEWMRFRRVWLAHIDGKLAGVAVNLDLPLGWSELAVLYVFEEHRGQHIGKELFARQLEDVRTRKRNTYVASRNPIVIGWMQELGLKITPGPFMLPLPVQLRNLMFAIHPYRITEFIRKRRLFGPQPPFVHGYGPI